MGSLKSCHFVGLWILQSLSTACFSVEKHTQRLAWQQLGQHTCSCLDFFGSCLWPSHFRVLLWFIDKLRTQTELGSNSKQKGAFQLQAKTPICKDALSFFLLCVCILSRGCDLYRVTFRGGSVPIPCPIFQILICLVHRGCQMPGGKCSLMDA